MSKKVAALAGIPLRIGASMGLVFLGYQLPYVALGILVFGIIIGVVGLAIVWALRQTFRMRNRFHVSSAITIP